MVKELVQRFDRYFSKLGVKDFKKSFSGPLPLQEYFLSVDHHFQVRVEYGARKTAATFSGSQQSVCVSVRCVLAACQC